MAKILALIHVNQPISRCCEMAVISRYSSAPCSTEHTASRCFLAWGKNAKKAFYASSLQGNWITEPCNMKPNLKVFAQRGINCFDSIIIMSKQNSYNQNKHARAVSMF